MHHHIRHLTDIQASVTHREEEEFATFLDVEKIMSESFGRKFFAFGKIGHGASFIDWVRLLYTNTREHLMINGNIAPFITP